MDPKFQKIAPAALTGNVFDMLDRQWMLVCAGQEGDYNMMTASWGGFGILWKQPVAYVFIRPQRFTYRFAEKYGQISLCFFDEAYREMLNYCGSHSGREGNKTTAAGLTPMPLPGGGVAFSEASLVMETEKIYYDDIEPKHFLDRGIGRLYPADDFHRMYICTIHGIYLRNQS